MRQQDMLVVFAQSLHISGYIVYHVIPNMGFISESVYPVNISIVRLQIVSTEPFRFFHASQTPHSLKTHKIHTLHTRGQSSVHANVVIITWFPTANTIAY